MRTVIYGLPKSGTTYLFSLLAQAMSRDKKLVESFEPRSKDENNRLHRHDGQFWDESENMLVKILYADANKNSGWEGAQAKKSFDYYDKKIFLIRDPRDRWISAFFYRWFYRHNPDKKDFERALALSQKKEKNPDQVPFHKLLSSDPQVLKNWAKEYTHNLHFLTDFINGLKLNGWYILKYEDLVDKNWKDLEEYLGFSLELEHDIRKSFKHVSRTNQYGNWRRWFTLEDVIFFTPIFNNFLQSHGYDSVDWDLEKINSLPSVEGSDYMKKLFYHKNGPNSYSKNILGELKRFIWGNSIRVE